MDLDDLLWAISWSGFFLGVAYLRARLAVRQFRHARELELRDRAHDYEELDRYWPETASAAAAPVQMTCWQALHGERESGAKAA